MACSDLQAVEAAPRDTDHGNLAVAPGLLGDPGDGFATIELLLNRVFVADQALAVACAPDVDAYRRVAVAGKVRVQALVAGTRTVALAIGKVFENCGHGLTLGCFRQPELGSKARSIGKRDKEVFDNLDRVGEVGPDLSHGPSAC